MATLHRIDVKSAVRTMTLLGVVVGFIAGVLYSVGGFFIDLLTIGLNGGTALAFGALIGMPLLGGLWGLGIGLVGALGYNMIARRFGGIRYRSD